MQQLNPSEISDIIKNRIENLDVRSEAQNEGTIVGVSDGIVRIHGLAEAKYGEMIEFNGGLYGMALNLERDSVGAVILVTTKVYRKAKPPAVLAAFWKYRLAQNCWAAWSIRWATPSTAAAPSTQPRILRSKKWPPALSRVNRSTSRYKLASRRSMPWCPSAAASAN